MRPFPFCVGSNTLKSGTVLLMFRWELCLVRKRKERRMFRVKCFVSKKVLNLEVEKPVVCTKHCLGMCGIWYVYLYIYLYIVYMHKNKSLQDCFLKQDSHLVKSQYSRHLFHNLSHSSHLHLRFFRSKSLLSHPTFNISACAISKSSCTLSYADSS